MGIQKTDAGEIAKRAAELFRNHGYHGTSMADVANACGLLKGSLYHHFPGKEDLAIDVLERIRRDFHERIFAIANGHPADSRAALGAMLHTIERYFLDTRGCLMGAIGLEMSEGVPRIRTLIQGFFDEWVAAFADLLTPVAGRKKALAHAQDMVIRIEGAVMWLHIHDDPAPLRRACRPDKASP